jgi:hypothetical protein
MRELSPEFTDNPRRAFGFESSPHAGSSDFVRIIRNPALSQMRAPNFAEQKKIPLVKERRR